jgi:hypothetical protein
MVPLLYWFSILQHLRPTLLPPAPSSSQCSEAVLDEWAALLHDVTFGVLLTALPTVDDAADAALLDSTLHAGGGAI